MNEWGFAGEIKAWWGSAIEADPSLGLGRVTIEETAEGEATRADITLYGADDRQLMILELRLPDHPEADPFAIPNVMNAMQKAMLVGARWSATSDGLDFRLLDHHQYQRPLRERAVPVDRLTVPATRADLDITARRQAIRSAWVDLLERLAPIVTDRQTAPQVAPDEFFIESLRASLARPFAEVRDALDAKRTSDAVFSDALIAWMVGEQGWTHDARFFQKEVERVARVVTYVFATRLLFYGALRRARTGLPALELPQSGDPTASRLAVKGVFEHAREVTGDYATVFITDDVSNWALISQPAGKSWSRVLEVLDHFELETLGFDVLGRLFERLIDPEERYEWGQHYTSPDVVDLMLSAALPEAEGPVMDPAFMRKSDVSRDIRELSVVHAELKDPDSRPRGYRSGGRSPAALDVARESDPTTRLMRLRRRSPMVLLARRREPGDALDCQLVTAPRRGRSSLRSWRAPNLASADPESGPPRADHSDAMDSRRAGRRGASLSGHDMGSVAG